MKNPIYRYAGIALLLLLGCLTFSCTRNKSEFNGDGNPAIPMSAISAAKSGYLKNLRAHKASPHEITAAFYRMYGARSQDQTDISEMVNLPDSLDIALAFLFTRNSSPSIQYQMKNVVIPALRAKGTKVLVSGFDLLTIPDGVPHNEKGYKTTAKFIMDSLINKFGFDGLDIDVESNPSGTDLADKVGVFTALSAYLGPKSGKGKLLTFDTNQSGTNSMFRQVYTMVNYVFLQAYGRGTSGFQGTLNTFTPYITASQFVPGFSFYEEFGYPGNVWNDVTYPRNGTGRAYDYARWEPTSGKKGGVFGYAIDRDAPLTSMYDNTNITPDYQVTKDLIQIMNPAIK